jgi:hypothetical protein
MLTAPRIFKDAAAEKCNWGRGRTPGALGKGQQSVEEGARELVSTSQ